MFFLFQRRTMAVLALLFALVTPPRISGAENLSPLGVSPDWGSLERYQETITHDDFQRLLEGVYCTRGVSEELIKLDDASARILMTKSPRSYFTLRFAESEATRRPLARSTADQRRRWTPGSPGYSRGSGASSSTSCCCRPAYPSGRVEPMVLALVVERPVRRAPVLRRCWCSCCTCDPRRPCTHGRQPSIPSGCRAGSACRLPR